MPSFIRNFDRKLFALNYSTNNGSSFTTYYYVLNLQGDVVKLITASGSTVATYSYDAWGKVLTATGEKAEINPLRYRGYYYDAETGFYYLQSRYYDPELHRFINADTYASTDSGDAISCNMFAYCCNNPISRSDESGEFWHIVIGAAVGALVSAACTVVENISSGKDWKEGVLLSAATGAITGAITATGVGAIASGVACAVVEGGANIIEQGLENGFDNINYSEAAFEAVVGGISGATSAVGKGLGKHLMNQGVQATKRVASTISHRGLKAGFSVAKKAAKYYFSQTYTMYYRPLIKGAIDTVGNALKEGIVRGSIIWTS